MTILIYVKQITGSEGGGGRGRGEGGGWFRGGRFLVLGLVGQVDFPVGCIHHNITPAVVICVEYTLCKVDILIYFIFSSVLNGSN